MERARDFDHRRDATGKTGNADSDRRYCMTTAKGATAKGELWVDVACHTCSCMSSVRRENVPRTCVGGDRLSCNYLVVYQQITDGIGGRNSKHYLELFRIMASASMVAPTCLATNARPWVICRTWPTSGIFRLIYCNSNHILPHDWQKHWRQMCL